MDSKIPNNDDAASLASDAAVVQQTKMKPLAPTVRASSTGSQQSQQKRAKSSNSNSNNRPSPSSIMGGLSERHKRTSRGSGSKSPKRIPQRNKSFTKAVVDAVSSVASSVFHVPADVEKDDGGSSKRTPTRTNSFGRSSVKLSKAAAALTMEELDLSSNHHRNDLEDGSSSDGGGHDVETAKPVTMKKKTATFAKTTASSSSQKPGKRDLAPARPNLDNRFSRSSTRTLKTERDASFRSDLDDLATPVANASQTKQPTKQHTTLAEIRRRKLREEEAQQKKKQQTATRSGTCCGLHKCTWFWIFVVCAAVGGGVGYYFYPSLFGDKDAQQSDSAQVVMTPPPTTQSVAPPREPDFVPPEEEGEPKPLEPLPPPVNVWKAFDNDDDKEDFPAFPHASTQHLSQPVQSSRHLTQAARLLVKSALHANVHDPQVTLEKIKNDNSDEDDYVVPFIDTPLMHYDSQAPYPTHPRRRTNDKYPLGDMAAWEAAMQSAGIHEADGVVQWDTHHRCAYVAHGDHIDVMDTTTGSLRTSVALPEPVVIESSVPITLKDSLRSADESSPKANFPMDWTPAPPRPFVEQILLTSSGDYLVVLVTNYTHVHQSVRKPILRDSLATHILTYQVTHTQVGDTSITTTLELVDRQPHQAIHGRLVYAAQATSNQHIHIVTSSKIDSDRLLEKPLERMPLMDPSQKDTDASYVESATQMARDKYLDLFADRLTEALEQLGDNETLTVLPWTPWITSDIPLHGGQEPGEEDQHLEQFIAAQSQMEELILVTSLSITKTSPTGVGGSAAANPRLQQMGQTATSTSITSTAFVGPSNVEVLGSTETQLSLSVPGYQWLQTGGRVRKSTVLQEATHILKFELGMMATSQTSRRAATRFHTMGTVPGRLVQAPRHATKIRGTDLRLATVLAKQWKAETVDQPEGEGEEYLRRVVQETTVLQSFLHVLDVDTLEPRPGSPLELFKGESTHLSSIALLDNVAYAFPTEKSLASKKAKVQVVEFVKLRRPTPAMILSGELATGPVGFSPHMHELAIHEKLLVSIGEDKDKDGSSTGWVVTLWDAMNPTILQVVAQHALGIENAYTEWQPKAFRVTPQGQLIAPLTVEYTGADSQQDDMTGFVILDLSNTQKGITEIARIPHSASVMDRRNDCVVGEMNCHVESRIFFFNTAHGEEDSRNELSLITLAGESMVRTKLSMVQGNQIGEEGWRTELP